MIMGCKKVDAWVAQLTVKQTKTRVVDDGKGTQNSGVNIFYQ
jgi:hypothetical protein